MNGVAYVFVAQFCTSLMLGAIFLLAWRTIEPRPHTLSWALAFSLATVQYVLNAVVNFVPVHGLARDLYWVLVNAMALVVQALAWAGFRQRAGLRGWPQPLVVYLVAVEALVVWFTLVKFHQGLRMVLIPWSGTFLLAACAWVLVRPGRKLRAAEWGAVVVLLLFSLGQLVAGAAALMQGAAPNEHYLALYTEVNLLAMPALYTGLGLFAVLILADDLADRMRTLAVTDELTGVVNRRGFEEAAARALAVARRQGEPTCVALLDLDHFKAVNDTHGHFVGDGALKTVATALVEGVRAGDVVGRMGGEEFAVLLPATDLSWCAEIVERLRLKVEATSVEAARVPLRVTASFGVAPVTPDDQSIHEALKHADQALYAAKRAGRNRVRVGARGAS
jgi:diguanylate cyclase (GGDEF)-like protein